MKKIISILTLAILATFAVATFASAEETKMVGVITKIQVAADGASATTMIKDNKTATEVAITVTDTLTLDKMKDKRIVEGDEVRIKYDVVDGKNVARLFRKTAGC